MEHTTSAAQGREHMTYRPTSDPKTQARICATCHQRIIGTPSGYGWTIWTSDTPLSPALEAIHLAASITTYRIRPRHGGTAWIDRRWPVPTARDLTAILLGHAQDPGHLILAEHPHRTPGPRTSAPDWLTPPRRATATQDTEEAPF